MSRFWIGATIAFAFGALCGHLELPWLSALPMGIAVFLAHRWDHRLLWVFCTAVGVLGGANESNWRATVPSAPTAPFHGEVHQIKRQGDAYRVVISPDESPDHRVVLTRATRPVGLAPGALVRVYGRVVPLRIANNPGGFDAKDHGVPLRISWQGHGELWMTRRASPVAEIAIEMQEEAHRRLEALDRSFGARVLAGVLLGDRRAVPEDARKALQATGAAHLMAVSGLHVGGLALLIFGLVRRLANRLGAVRPWRVAALSALPPTGLFVVLAGAPASAVRAGLMVGVYLMGVVLSRRCQGLDALAIAAIVLVAGCPAAAQGVGFQLSFIAVAALLVFAAGHRGLRALALTAVIASLATAPIQAWHFGTVAPLGPIANLVLSPFAALVVVPLGLLGLLCAPLTSLPLSMAAAAAELLSTTAEVMAAWTSGPWVVGGWTAPLCCLPIWLWWTCTRGYVRTAILGTLLLMGAGLYQRPGGALVDFVSVGQGDAIILRSAGQVAMIDAGPQRSAFELGNYLRREGIGRLDWVLVTHGHPDHFRGLYTLMQSVEIGTVWYNGHRSPGREWLDLRARLEQRQIPVVPVPVGRHRIGELRLAVFEPLTGVDVSENDASVVVRVDGPGGSILLTGDVEAAGEAGLPPEWVANVDVLKAPHHGSRTSSGPALLKTACPRATVYSVGHGNRYGLPHPEVVARYARWGIAAWRTDRDGRVRIQLGAAASIEGYRRDSVSLTDLPRSCTRTSPEVALDSKEPRS